MHDFKSQPRRLLVLLFATVCALILVGCASLTSLFGRNDPPAPAPAPVACEIFTPICWSTRDSDQTLAQIHEHNRVWRQLCPSTPNPCAQQ